MDIAMDIMILVILIVSLITKNVPIVMPAHRIAVHRCAHKVVVIVDAKAARIATKDAMNIAAVV